MKWKKYCVLLVLLFLAFLPLSAESNEALEIPELEPEAEYVMTGQDIMTLYQTVKNLNETKNEWKNLTLEAQTNSENALKLAKEYESENQKLALQNNFLVGTTVCSVGIVVAGVITLVVMNVN